MKIPTASAPNVPYYHGPANGMELNPQWQGNGVILEGGPPGNGGPYMVPHHVHPAGFAPPGGFYQGAGAPGQPQDFSEYMWMENEEEFDKQVMQQLEEEALMEQCIEAMLADEREALGRGDVNLEEAVSKSTLNPLAAEFVPTFIPAGAADAADIPTVSSRGTSDDIETSIEKASETLGEVSLNKSDDTSKPKDIDTPPTDDAIKTNNVSKAVVKAVEAVVVVSAIEGLVKEDKRHPKSDVERKRSSESVKKEAAKKVEGKEPKKADGKEPVKRVDSKESVKKTDIKEAVKKVDGKEAIKKVDSKEPLKKVDSKEPVKKVDSKEPVKKVDSKEPLKKVDSKEPLKKVDSKEPVKKVDSKEPLKKVESKEPAKKVEGKEPLKKVDSKEAVKRADVKRPPKAQPVAAKVAEKKKEDVVIDLQGPPLPSVATAAPVEVEKPQVSAPAVFNYAAAARANLPPKAAPAASAPPSKETTPVASVAATAGNQTAPVKQPTDSANKDTPRNAGSTAAKTKPTEKGGVKDDKRPFKSVGAAKKGKK